MPMNGSGLVSGSLDHTAGHGDTLLQRARFYAGQARDELAKHAYVDVLRQDPHNFPALSELGALAAVSGHRTAARTAYSQAVRYHPDNPVAHVGLGNLLAEEGDLEGARFHYEAAVRVDPGCAPAHQGLARLLTDLGDLEAAEPHWAKGFVGHAVVSQRYCGANTGIPLLLLVSARGGNVPTRPWIDDRIFAVTAIHAEYHDPSAPLPPHRLVVNAIGDADLCGVALERAEAILGRCAGPVVNPPVLVRATGRVANARRMGGLPGVVAPRTVLIARDNLVAAADLDFPLLLRAPGFHTGRHFVHVGSRDDLAVAAASLPGDRLLAIEYLDARGRDLMARKYRVMFIDGACYPMHLAISSDWKVHYFSSAMAANLAHRQEEERFLRDMPGVLGHSAVAALAGIGARLGLDYAGVDFALAPDGSVLLFEANATMVINPPDPDPMWDYRRPAMAAVEQAAKRMLIQRTLPPPPPVRRPLRALHRVG